MSDGRPRRKRGSTTAYAATTGVFVVLLSVGSLIYLRTPTRRGTLSVTAVTGSLTLEPLCDGSVTWDLPAGRVGRRSVAPGRSGYESSVEAVTLVLAPGSRARVIAPEDGPLRVSIEKSDDIAQLCPSAASQPYRLILDGASVAADPVGFNYEARVNAQSGPTAVSLPLTGRVILGQTVLEGAAWRARSTPMLLEGTITRRVKLWLTGEVMTVGEPERLDEGSIFDSHACMDSGSSGARPASECSTDLLMPAVGFFRTMGSGALKVELYAWGPSGVQNYLGPVHRIEVPLSTALWESDTIKVWGAFLILIFTCLEQIERVGKAAWKGIRFVGTKIKGQRVGSRRRSRGRLVDSRPMPAMQTVSDDRSTATERFHEKEIIEQAIHKKNTV